MEVSHHIGQTTAAWETIQEGQVMQVPEGIIMHQTSTVRHGDRIWRATKEWVHMQPARGNMSTDKSAFNKSTGSKEINIAVVVAIMIIRNHI